jgi:pilus assembly protein Flp/PilA
VQTEQVQKQEEVKGSSAGVVINHKEVRVMSLSLKKLNEKVLSRLRNERGQGLVEYALILVLIALVVMAAVHTVGNTTKSTFSNIDSGLRSGG